MGMLFGEGFDTPIKPFTLPSARIHGYGGPHTAYTDDINTLFINPAALKTAKQFSVLDLSIGTTGDVLSLGQFAMDMMESGSDVDYTTIGDFAKKTGGKLPLGVGLPGLTLGYVGKGFGLGLFTNSYLDANVIGMDVNAAANVDAMLNIGFSFKIFDTKKHTLDVGVTGKAFGRYGMEIESDFLLIADDFDTLTDKLEDYTVYIGGGVDIGSIYTRGKLKAALVWNDVFSPAAIIKTAKEKDSWGVVESKLNAGLSYKLLALSLLDLSVMADYRDIFNLFNQSDYRSRNPWLNLGVGVEAKLLKFISLRVGMNDMLPSFGVGFDLVIFKLAASIYGKELGNDPGVMSTYGLDCGILFRY
jgi:hypothetical protein